MRNEADADDDARDTEEAEKLVTATAAKGVMTGGVATKPAPAHSA